MAVKERITTDISDHESKLKQAKKSLRDYANQQKSVNSVLGTVTSSIGKFAAGLGVGMTAVEGLKKLLNSSETSADDYGRAMQMVTTVSNNFFYALNTGNLDNWFSNLNQSIQAAKELYDALDNVGSIRMNNRAAIAIQERLLRELRVRKQRGENVDDQILATQGRISSLKGQEVTATRDAAIKRVVAELSDTVDEAFAQKIAAQLFGKGQDYYRYVDEQLDKISKPYTKMTPTTTVNSMTGASTTTWAEVVDTRAMSEKDRRLYEVFTAIKEKEAGLAEAIGMWADAENMAAGISQQEFMSGRWAGAGSSGKGGSKSSKVEKAEKEPKALFSKNQLWDMGKEQYESNLDELTDSSLVDEFIATQKKLADSNFMNDLTGDNMEFNQYISNLKDMQKAADETRSKYENTADAIGMFGSSLSQIGSNLGVPALNIMGTIAQAIANVMLGYAQATAEGAKLGPIGWAAFALSGLAEVTSIIAQMKSISKFAEGGIAYGPTLGIFGEYSGAAHNPEVVAPLDKLQSMIGGSGGGTVEFHIQGKELVGILNKQSRINSRNA